MYDFYLAAPFFNTAQVDLVGRIHAAMTSRGYNVFSPVKDSPQFHPVKTLEQGRMILDSNIVGMRQSKVLFAVLDWMLPPNESVYHEREQLAERERNDTKVRHKKTRLNLPDSGVVFEHGFFFGLSRAIVLFKSDEASSINVMLALSAHAVVRGFDILEKFLGTEGRLNFSAVPPYDGGLL